MATQKENTRTHEIDAKGKRLGRVATEAASILLGKDLPTRMPNEAVNVTVRIVNARLLDIPEKKQQEEYQTYSGYPGGQKTETVERLATRRGYSEVVRRTVSGMIPKNKLHKVRMKHLEISE